MSKENSRIYFTFSILLGAALVLTGCSGQPASTGSAGGQGASPGPEKIVITVNNGALEEDKEQQEENQAKQQVFYEQYPHIRIEESTWQFDMPGFLAKMAGGTCTDVVGVPQATELKGIAAKGLALDLTPFLEDWEGREYLNPIVMKNYTVTDDKTGEKKVYGLPAGPGYAMGLGINIKRFEEAGLIDESGLPVYPRTWTELAETAQKLTDRDSGRVGFVLLGGDTAASWHFLNFLYQAGGDVMRQEDGKWKAVFNEAPGVKALEFVKNLRWKYKCIQSDVFLKNDKLLEMLASGSTAMAVITPEFMRHLERKYGMDLANLHITPLPKGPAGDACVMGGGFGMINPTISRKKQEAAFKLLTFELSPEAHRAAWEVRIKQGRVVGYPGVAHLTGEWQEKWEKYEDELRNIPDFPEYEKVVSNSARFEPPHFTQQWYSEIMLPVLQEVLTKENSDPKLLLDQAAERFQTRFLDRM